MPTATLPQTLADGWVTGAAQAAARSLDGQPSPIHWRQLDDWPAWWQDEIVFLLVDSVRVNSILFAMAPSLYTGTLGGKKQKVECPPPPPPPPPTSAPGSPETTPKKRVLSDETKQKLAAARQRKKEEKEAAQLAETQEQERAAKEQEEAERAAAEKKEAAAAKRREARLKRKEAQSSGSGSKESTPEPKRAKAEPKDKSGNESDAPVTAKRSGKQPASTSTKTGEEKIPDEPPAWFTKYVTSMLGEKRDQEGIKTSKKEIREEGRAAAHEKWEDKFTRDRIKNAVDGHMGEMYSMIFA